MIKKKIAVIGFGYIGSIIGIYLASKGFKVIGFDKNQRILSDLSKGINIFKEKNFKKYFSKAKKNLYFTSEIKDLKDCSIKIISVGTPLNKNFTPLLNEINNVVYDLKQSIQENDTIIFKSTLPIGVSRKIFFKLKNVINKNFFFGFCPERLAEGNAFEEFSKLPIVVSGIDKRSILNIENFWKKSLKIQTIKMSSLESAELVKLSDNFWIDLNIAAANEVSKLANYINVPTDEVLKAANSLPKGDTYVNFLKQSFGVGGYCLTKDPWFLYNFAKKNNIQISLPAVSRKINDSMPSFTYKIIQKEIKKIKYKNIKILVLGLSFKSNTSDIRFSPTFNLIDKFISNKYNIDLFDPLVSKSNLENKYQKLYIDKLIKFDSYNIFLFLTAHEKFKNIFSLKFLNKSKKYIIFDGRGYFNKDISSKNIKYIKI